MKILYINLRNYIGIYNGMGLNELEIDFSKCMYKTIQIKGGNGRGKSSLMKAIHPLPDSNDALIPCEPAHKLLTLLDNNTIYDIKIIHGVKSNGNRETTKAYITKHSPNGESLELNPNGNVSSYKDVLFTEFLLDSNLLALSQVSGDERGLVDKIPSERKKFVNSIIDTLQAYNNIYKILTKKSSIYKSLLNSTVNKIENIGNEHKLKIKLQTITSRLEQLIKDKEKYNNEIINLKSKINIIDSDGSIQNAYKNIYDNITSINDKLTKVTASIDSLKSRLNLAELDNESIQENYKKILEDKNNMSNRLEICQTVIDNLLSSREEDSNYIQNKTAKLDSITSEKNYLDLKKFIKQTTIKVNEMKSIIDRLGIKDISNISKDEFISAINIIHDIKEYINSLRYSYNHIIIEKALPYAKSNTKIDIKTIMNKIDEQNTKIESLNTQYQEYTAYLKSMEKLSLRPSNCKIDTCDFIKDSLFAKEKQPNEMLDKLDKELIKHKQLLTQLKESLEESHTVNECIDVINTMFKSIDTYLYSLNKLPYVDMVTNKDILMNNILSDYEFKELDNIYELIEYSNIIDEYKSLSEQLKDMKGEYKLYEAKQTIIDELTLDINTLNKKLQEDSKTILEKNDELNKLKVKLEVYNSYINDYEELLKLNNDYNALMLLKKDEGEKYSKIKNDITFIKESQDKIESLESIYSDIVRDIEPLTREKSKIVYNLALLEQYNSEMVNYQNNYNSIEIIRKYSSPNGGIQTLFMEIYMNKTLELANELLSLLFGGDYILDNFIINDTEFRIPCIGQGIKNSDVSSMSTSQKCMISMILSFVLLQQAGSRYNIIKLDEIDGGLDTENRLQFLEVLKKQIELLNTEQVIIISHNSEMDSSESDIIQLKTSSTEISEGNIIFSC